MDRISTLPDELLLRILSFLPTTKDVVVTMVLSKRWQPQWMMVPKLIYNDDSFKRKEYGRFLRFVDRSLLLHKAPILETLHFKVSKTCGVGDIPLWTRAADKHYLHELLIEINCSSSASPAVLPRSLYMGCRMLVTLKLNNAILVNLSSPVSFPSLKTLSLVSVTYPDPGNEFVNRFLSNCLVLENLVVEQCPYNNVTIFTVRVPSLKSLVLHTSQESVLNPDHGFVIDAPSLEYLDIVDYRGGFCVIENEMPNIVKADVDAIYSHPWKILGSISSVKRLNLCLTSSKDAYPVASVSNRLVHLRLCTCETEWLNLLLCLLRDSPILQSLKLDQCHNLWAHQRRPCWSEPSVVPECVISSLETLEWVKYEGTEEEKELVAFILRSANCLKKATISSNSTDPKKKLNMIKELSSSPRRSPTCQLIFD